MPTSQKRFNSLALLCVYVSVSCNSSHSVLIHCRLVLDALDCLAILSDVTQLIHFRLVLDALYCLVILSEQGHTILAVPFHQRAYPSPPFHFSLNL